MNILVDGQTLSTPDVRRGIGRVLIQLCEEIVPSDRSQEWYFAVRSEEHLAELGEEAQRFAIPLVTSAPPRDGDAQSRSRAYSRELSRLCSQNDIRLYWNPNPLMLNVTLPLELTGVLKVCTVYDLIPLMMSKAYRETWPRQLRDDYDTRVERLPGWADHMAFISQGSRDDYRRLDPAVEARSSVIHLGADHTTFWAPAVPDASASPPYVLLVGGADPRKNLERAIVAFAAARSKEPRLAETHLVIVGSSDGESRRRLGDIAKAEGVADRMRLHDYVDDPSLARLYRQAAAFFFPSLYEGFGLPVVEAMACGVPAVISDRPELRECAGEWAYTCDPTCIDGMAAALVEALTNEDRNRANRPRLIERASHFDWVQSAAHYAGLFDRLGATPRRGAGASRRLRVAWLSPWPPSRSGVADYSAEITETLKGRVDIDLFLENPDDVKTESGLTAHPIDEIRHRRGEYDAIIYHLGNNSDHHAKIYRLAWEIPGIVVMHDFNIHPFLHNAYLGTPEEWLYRDALVEAHGPEGLTHFEAVRAGRCDADVWKYALSQAIAARSRGVIVHSAWARRALGKGPNVFTVPLFARIREPRSPDEILHLRDSLGLKTDRFVIGLFGFLNAQKRIPVVLEACARLRERGYPVQLLLVGSKIDPDLPLSEQIAEYGAKDLTTHTGYVSEAKFWDYLDASDVVMNLRYPTMGESSLSLSRAFGSGKPCLVTDFCQFAEIPDSVCWKSEVGPYEVDQIVAYLEELLGDPDLRYQLGENARRFAADYASKERAAVLYESAVAAVHE